MKKLVFALILVLTSNLYSQTFSSSLNDKLITAYTDSGGVAVTNSPSLQHNYIVEANKKDTGYLEVILKSSKDGAQKESFLLKPLSIDLFVPKFKVNYAKIIKNSENLVMSDEKFNEAKLSILFAKLISFERTEDERPVVANITIRDNIPIKIYFQNPEKKEEKKKKKKKKKKGKMSNEDCNDIRDYKIRFLKNVRLELTFYNGFIEKVELEGDILNESVRFTNLFSIGISSTDGIRKFSDHKLQSFSSYFYTSKTTNGIIAENISRHRSSDSLCAWPLDVNFSDIIDYDREIDINANDISPEPTKLVLDAVQKSTKLYKPNSTKLFEAVVYSDFFGVFDEESPNGIIQTEVSKKFYINTKREAREWYSYFFPPAWYSDAIGVGEYINLNAKFSKIEENNKFLKPELNGTDFFFSPLRIKQHESFSIGGDINLLSFENQNKKINTYIDLGWNYGRSGLQFSEENKVFLNTITASGNVAFHFIPEKRYGFIASNRISRFMILNDNLIENEGFSFKSLNNAKLVSPNNWLNFTEIEFYLNTSTTGKLFVRYSLITDLNDWDNNFSQFQFGYSFYILKQNGKIK